MAAKINLEQSEAQALAVLRHLNRTVVTAIDALEQCQLREMDEEEMRVAGIELPPNSFALGDFIIMPRHPR